MKQSLILLLGLISTSVLAVSSFEGSEFLNQSEFRTQRRDSPVDRLIMIPDYNWHNSSEDLKGRAQFLGWYNYAEDLNFDESYMKKSEIRIQNLHLTKTFTDWSFSAGWMSIENGETFGGQRPNFLFPVSYENYVFDEEKLNQVSQATTLLKYLYNGGAVEFIYVPIHENYRLPRFVRQGRIKENFRPRKVFRDSEESIRWTHFWNGSGIETNLLASRHFSRIPVYNITTNSSGERVFNVQNFPMKSYSLGVNKALDYWVIRGDATYHDGLPFMLFKKNRFTKKQFYDAVLAVEYDWDQDTSLTTQFHWVDNGEPESPLYFASIWWKQFIYEKILEIETGYYVGINNADQNLNARLNYTFEQHWEASLAFIKFTSRPRGFFQIIDQEDRIQATVSYTY